MSKQMENKVSFRKQRLSEVYFPHTSFWKKKETKQLKDLFSPEKKKDQQKKEYNCTEKW